MKHNNAPILFALFLAGCTGGIAAFFCHGAFFRQSEALPVLVDAYQPNGLLKLYTMSEDERMQLQEFEAAISSPHGRKALREADKRPYIDLAAIIRLGIDVPGFGRRGDVVIVLRRRRRSFFATSGYVSEIWVNATTGKRIELFPKVRGPAERRKHPWT